MAQRRKPYATASLRHSVTASIEIENRVLGKNTIENERFLSFSLLDNVFFTIFAAKNIIIIRLCGEQKS